MSGPSGPAHASVGVLRGCDFEVVARDLLTIAANLLIVALWADGLAMPSLSIGGLDVALGGALVRLRADGIFRAGPGETMLISSPPPRIAVDAVMLLGIGERDGGTDAHIRRGLRCGADQAMLLRADHVAFTPMLLGAKPGELPTPERMDAIVLGIADALASDPTYNRRWTFVVDDDDLGSATELLRVAISRAADHDRPDEDRED